MELNVVFQNVYQGMHFAQVIGKRDVFYKYWPSAYIDYYREKTPNIVCLAEIPLDDENGESTFLENFSRELLLPNVETYINEKSWIVEGKWYGTAILSKFPILKYESFNLPNPKLEVDHKDGTRWVMHDKGAQKALVDIGGTQVAIYNLHYFPFHHFNRKIDEIEFHGIRSELANVLLPGKNIPAIVCGDFNNKYVAIDKAFPELFENGRVSQAITFNRNDYEKNFEGDETQIDHILYTKSHFDLLYSSVESNYSDHCGLFAKFKLLN